MPQFCNCGAQLPDNARFCHSCGKPQRDEDIPVEPAASLAAPLPLDASPGRPLINFSNPVVLRVALLCASLSALLNAIPIVSLGCCLWIIGGGFLSTWLYVRRTGTMLSTAEGARLGWITGLLTFVITIFFTA